MVNTLLSGKTRIALRYATSFILVMLTGFFGLQLVWQEISLFWLVLLGIAVAGTWWLWRRLAPTPPTPTNNNLRQ